MNVRRALASCLSLARGLLADPRNVGFRETALGDAAGLSQALIAGRVSTTVDNLGPLYPFIQSGQLIVLGVSTSETSSLLSGGTTDRLASVLDVYFLSPRNVMTLPAGTPKAIVAKVSAEFDRILRIADVVQRVASFGSRPIGGTPEDVVAFLKDERVRWQAAVNAAKIMKGQFD